jgi:small subunit ribosomal protein S2
VRNGVHIIDLEQTVPMMNTALKALRDIVAQGGRVMFVGTKRQAQDAIAAAAKRCGQYYINHRWLGGTLTNWRTVSQTIARLRELDEILSTGGKGRGKKELVVMTRERDKLEQSIGGIKELGGLPDALFVIDTIKEDIAIKEANRLGIPVFAIVDTNSDPKGVTFPIPGNDDALRAIELYCNVASEAVLDGLQAELSARGSDKDSGDGSDKVARVRKGKKEEAKAPAAAGDSAMEEQPKKQATA